MSEKRYIAVKWDGDTGSYTKVIDRMFENSKEAQTVLLEYVKKLSFGPAFGFWGVTDVWPGEKGYDDDDET